MSGKTLKKLKNFYEIVKKVFTFLVFMVYLYGSVFEVFGKTENHIFPKGSPYGGTAEAMMNYSFTVPSLLILVIIMGYYFLRPRVPIRLNRAFLAILVIDIGTVLFDFVTNRLNETWQFHSPVLLWVFYLLFFTFYLTRIYMFFVFTISVLDARGAIRSSLHIYTPVIYFPSVALVLSSPLTHWVFRIREGFHTGPMYFIIYFCSFCYLLFSLLAIWRGRAKLTANEKIGLVALQLILVAGNIVRMIVPNFMVMNTFCLMAIMVIFLSFQNPDLFLSDRGYVYNLPAFRALLLEWYRRKRPSRLLSFVLQNYNEHREIFGGQQMDEALGLINRYLRESFPEYCNFYLRNGCYAIAGSDRMDVDALCTELEKRFSEPWKTETGDLLLNISFLRADTDLHGFPVDRLINTLLISLDETGQNPQDETERRLSDSMQAISEKLDVRRCLEKALDQNSLEVFLQPIVDSDTGNRIAAEALVRLRDDDGKIIRPDLFITLAERDGYIIRLGEQVLGKVCEFIRDHDLEAMGLQWINVNLSPNQFMSREVPERFQQILKEYGVSPQKIHLELTEQSMIDFALMQEQIRRLHEAGFEFALDDYGSGYSNLTRVRQYPFSNIKIDMEVVRNYFRDRDPLLPALMQAFKKMSFSITAEGIETEEMAEALRKIGCDYFQGYFFSRPLPMQEFLQLAA